MSNRKPIVLWESFQHQVEDAGLLAVACSSSHWQITNGIKNDLVNVWPNASKGFGMAPRVGKRRGGDIRSAIELAGPRKTARETERPPWEDDRMTACSHCGRQVGLIRRFWRWLF